MSSIQPIPQNFRLVDDNGYPTVEFKTYLDAILRRMGGITGGSYQSLTDAATITWDVDQKPNAIVVLGGNRNLASPTSLVAGLLFPYRLIVVQDGTGNRLLTWGGAYKFASGTAPTLSTAANAVDEFWFSSDGTNMKLITGAKDIR
jgi:hypothetical protein